MKSRQKVFYLVIALLAFLTRSETKTEESSFQMNGMDRILPGKEFINYITTQHPYTFANIGNKNYETVQIPFTQEEEVKEEENATPSNVKTVYQAMHFPGAMNDSFNLHSLPLSFDPYYGLRPPFNLQHPSNYMLGFNPYPSLSYAPYFPNMYNDPFRTGIYGGYGIGMPGMMSPYFITPFPEKQTTQDNEYEKLQKELERVQKRLNELQAQRKEEKQATNSSNGSTKQ